MFLGAEDGGQRADVSGMGRWGVGVEVSRRDGGGGQVCRVEGDGGQEGLVTRRGF